MGAARPLIEASRPPYKTDHHDLRRTIEAIIWRHDSGAKWRQIPAELGPWWMAAQTFGRWSRLGAWERLLELAQRRGGVEAGMAFLQHLRLAGHRRRTGPGKNAPPRSGAATIAQPARHPSGHHRAAIRSPRHADPMPALQAQVQAAT